VTKRSRDPRGRFLKGNPGGQGDARAREWLSTHLINMAPEDEDGGVLKVTLSMDGGSDT
jgi:hypothetical protein